MLVQASKGKDWNEIPVGLPFTEMVQKSKNFTETTLSSSKKKVRQTNMEVKQARLAHLHHLMLLLLSISATFCAACMRGAKLQMPPNSE